MSWWSWLDLLQDVRNSHQAGGLALFGLEVVANPLFFKLNRFCKQVTLT